MVTLGSGLQLAIVQKDGQKLLVVETIAKGGQSLILGSATWKNVDGLKQCFDAIRPMCNP
jgi:hypothetical protein